MHAPDSLNTTRIKSYSAFHLTCTCGKEGEDRGEIASTLNRTESLLAVLPRNDRTPALYITNLRTDAVACARLGACGSFALEGVECRDERGVESHLCKEA